MGGQFDNAPLSQILKLQNKEVRVINDVPLMEPITPHYLSLHLLKLPDVLTEYMYALL